LRFLRCVSCLSAAVAAAFFAALPAAFVTAFRAAVLIAALPPRLATAFAPLLKSILAREENRPAVAGGCLHFLQGGIFVLVVLCRC
jgi:hypothetical protein